MGEATSGDAPQQEHIVRIPYSLEIEDKLPRGMPYPHQVADQIAADMIASGQVRMQMWELLCDALPNGDPRREACADLPSSMCFTSGAYSQGPLFGIRRNTTLLPWVTVLVCKYIRSCTNVTFTSFVLQRNTSMRAHRDLNNAPGSSNVVLPCSSFAGGGLWLQSTTGHCPSLDGNMYGSVQNLTLSGVTFDPHQWHETRPWRGHCITIAIYTIKAVADLSLEHTSTLRRLEFAPPAEAQ